MWKIVTLISLSFIMFSCGKTVVKPLDDGIELVQAIAEGSVTYDCELYRISTKATIEELESYVIKEDVDFVNIYVSSSEKRIDVNDAQGLDLNQMLQKVELTVADLDQDYYEWVKVDGKVKNVAFQIKACRSLD